MEDEVKTDVALLVQDALLTGLASLFYLLTSLFFDVRVYGREHISDRHPTVIISNHKRDLDSVILTAVCYLGRGFARPNRRLVFGIREDIFWPRFLVDYIAWPVFLRPVIGRLNLVPILRMLRAEPIGYLASRKELPRIRRQLARFSDLLVRGRDVYWTPEGARTADGTFGRIRAGLYRLIKKSPAPLLVRPAAIFYDFATTARTRCFIRFGPEFAVDPAWSRAEIEQCIRSQVLLQMTVNAGHLAAGALLNLPERFSRQELEIRLRELLAIHRERGHFVDQRLMSGRTFQRRLDEFLRYAQREDVLRYDRGAWRVAKGFAHPSMRYLLNELAEIEPMVKNTYRSPANMAR